MELKMNARELAILQYVESLVPDADGVDVMLTALDEEGLPCFVYERPAASDEIYLYTVLWKNKVRKRVVIIPIPAGLFEWMGFSTERNRSSMFYRDTSEPDDLVMGLTFA